MLLRSGNHEADNSVNFKFPEGQANPASYFLRRDKFCPKKDICFLELFLGGYCRREFSN
jgi:hypothetical protein